MMLGATAADCTCVLDENVLLWSDMGVNQYWCTQLLRKLSQSNWWTKNQRAGLQAWSCAPRLKSGTPPLLSIHPSRQALCLHVQAWTPSSVKVSVTMRIASSARLCFRRASAAVNYLKRFHEKKKRGPKPHSLYLDHIVRKAVAAHYRRDQHLRVHKDIYVVKVMFITCQSLPVEPATSVSSPVHRPLHHTNYPTLSTSNHPFHLLPY